MASPTWTVHTDVFDGPMDLLLYLVRRDGIDLARLSVVQIADSYLAFIDRMREIHLGVAAEYLVMAATLCHLKSLALVPRAPTATTEDGEDAVDPAIELARRLQEYARFKAVADELDELPRLDRDVFSRQPDPLPTADRPLQGGLDPFALLELYHELLLAPPRLDPTLVVQGGGPDLEACCRHVLHVLALGDGRGELAPILRAGRSRGEAVVLFVAVLEMARLGWLDLDQAHHLGPVQLRALVTPDVDFGAIRGAVEVGA